MILEERILPVDVAYVSIDSRKRSELYPNPNNYVVPFDRVFQDVVSVELVYAIYPKFGDEDYVNLYIDELESNMISNCKEISGSFTQLPLLQPKNVYTREIYRSIRVFTTPLLKLGRFTIRFIGHDGRPYPIKEHLLRFEIQTLKMHQPSLKRAILTRDVLTCWLPVGEDGDRDGGGDGGGDGEKRTYGELTISTRASTRDSTRASTQKMSERECRQVLGIDSDASLYFQQVVDAYKAKKKSTIGKERELKEAFKALANIVASESRDQSRE